jgi:hypothetical protein
MDSPARQVALAELERYRFALLYAQRQQLKKGDIMGVARTLSAGRRSPCGRSRSSR